MSAPGSRIFSRISHTPQEGTPEDNAAGGAVWWVIYKGSGIFVPDMVTSDHIFNMMIFSGPYEKGKKKNETH